MGVISRVDRATEFLGDSTAEEEGEDLIVDAVGAILVKGEEDEGLIGIEVLVLQQRGKEVLKELSSKVDVGIVSVVQHIGCDEDPLRDSAVGDVDGEVVEVPLKLGTSWNGGDGVEDDEGVVFADVESEVGGGGVEVVVGSVAMRKLISIWVIK